MHVPLLLQSQNFLTLVSSLLHLDLPPPELTEWTRIAEIAAKVVDDHEQVQIAIVGKYTGLSDSYLSILKALEHSCVAVEHKLKVLWIASSHLCEGSEGYDEAWQTLRSAHGILIPGGFGHRGTEGKIIAARYARENGVPYFGICLGMQIAVIEFARNVLGLTTADTAENEVGHEPYVIIDMPEID
jgi:CTP synthase